MTEPIHDPEHSTLLTITRHENVAVGKVHRLFGVEPSRITALAMFVHLHGPGIDAVSPSGEEESPRFEIVDHA
ncbi:MAG: hypothetical protein IH969_05595 [Candidatus Krumholzibacteriota bacterium]|nr:hypothetical protein [Candidatus Krumholzibacteriota bacterium]